MRKFSVCGYSDDYCVAFFKLRQFVLEGVEFGWAYEREVFWIEEEYDVLAPLELGKRKFGLNFTTFDDGLCGERGGFFAYKYAHF